MAAESPVAVYSGQLVNGQAHGRGKLTDSDGSSYEGEWKEGKRQGLGVWRSAGGAQTYEGQWEADQKHGLGAVLAKDGVFSHCARWENGDGGDCCAVPLRLLPEGKWLSAAGQLAAAALLVSPILALRC